MPGWRWLARLILGLMLAGAAPLLAGCMLPPDLQSIMAAARGTGPGDAFVLREASQQGEILRLLGLERESRTRHMINGQPFDVVTARDLATGDAREVWFDISRYVGRDG